MSNKITLPICLILLSSSCTTPPVAYKKQAKQVVQQTSKGMSLIRQNVYEVVVLKQLDNNIKYERPLPLDKLTFKERTDKYISIGTAFTIQPHKYISAAHVFNPHLLSLNKEYYLRDIEGNVYKIGNVIRFSLKHDLIEFDLESPSKFKTFLKIGKVPEIGAQVFTVGNAQGEGISVRGGQVASYTPENLNGEWDYLRFSAPASPGNSGGPLLNKQGQVVGIVTMKNSEENLNYAMPVNELLKLPGAVATFQRKNVQFPLFERQVSQDMNFNITLPMKYEHLAQASEKKTREFSKSFLTLFKKKYQSEFFPYSKQSKQYLLDQSYLRYLASIHDHGDGKWHLHQPEYKYLELGNDRTLHFSTKDSSIDFLITKPTEMGLDEFLNRPDEIVGETLRALSVSRTVAGEKIKILSYGKPHEAFRFNDKLNRPWSVSIWRHHFTQQSSLVACTGVPQGAACSLAEVSTITESMSLVDILMEFAHLDQVSYRGSIKEWSEFLSINKKHLPKLFHESKVSFTPGQEFSFKLGTVSNTFRPTADITKASIIHTYVGLDPKSPMEQDIHEVGFYPNEKKSTNYSASVIFKPLPEMSTDLKEKWDNFSKRKDPYHSKIFINKDLKFVAIPLTTLDRSVASNVGTERGQMAFCKDESSASDKTLASNCKLFLKNLKFR